MKIINYLSLGNNFKDVYIRIWAASSLATFREACNPTCNESTVCANYLPTGESNEHTGEPDGRTSEGGYADKSSRDV